MTNKEKKELLRLRSENKELRLDIARHLKIYVDQAWELVGFRIKIDLIESALRGEE